MPTQIVEPHIALTRLGGNTSAKATEDIEVGGLSLPCFFRRSTSLVFGLPADKLSHKAVMGSVAWTTGEETHEGDDHMTTGEQTGEDDEPKVTIPIYVQP